MSAIAGQPSPKPQSLDKPVPGAETKDELSAWLAEASSPEIPAPSAQAASAPSNELDQFLASADQPAQAEDQFAPEPGFLQANADQFSNFVTRLQTGLAANDTEKFGFLQKKFGAENVTMKDDKIYFRKSNKDKFKRLDPATLEVVNDLIPDFAREMVTEAAMLPGELGGGVVGSMAGPAGTGAGVIGGRMASVPYANATADAVAAAAGVPQDETRNRYMENTVGIAAEGILPVVGSRILKSIPGTTAGQLAYRAAKEAGEREMTALSKQSMEVAKAVEDLAQAGKASYIDGATVGVPGTRVYLTAGQRVPESPQILQKMGVASSDPRFLNAQQKLAEDWGAAAKNTLAEIGRMKNPGVSNADTLAGSVVNAVGDIEAAEGKAIGQYKMKAMKQLQDQRLPLNQATTQRAQALLQEFGFTAQKTEKGMKLVPPKDIKPFVGKMGLTEPGQVRAVVNNLQQLSESMQKGGATLADLDRMRNSFGALTPSLRGTAASREIGALTGDLRQTYRQAIDAGLDNDFDRKAFNQAMDDYTMIRENIGTLKNALNEDLSAKAIVRSVFTGKENITKIQAIKKLSPESFENLRSEFIDQALVEFSDRSSPTGLKSGAFLAALDKRYGKDFLDEVFGDARGQLNDVQNFLTVTNRIEETFKKVSVDSMSETQKRGAMDTFIGAAAQQKFKMWNGITAMMRGTTGRDHILTQIMSRDGIDKYVANYPGKIDKKTVADNLNNILATSKVYKKMREVGANLQRPLKAATKQQMQEKAPQ